MSGSIRAPALAALVLAACGGAGGRPAAAPADTAAAPDTAVERDSAPAPAPASAAADSAGTARYVNSRKDFHGTRAEHYVDFSFRYPASWTVVQNASTPGTPNFVKVERKAPDTRTVASASVGWFGDRDAARGDPEALGRLVDFLSQQFGGAFPEFRSTGAMKARVAGREAEGFRFATTYETRDGPFHVWGRVLAIPTGGADGLVVVLFASELADGVDGPEDVGETGGLATVLRTLEIGAPRDGP